MRYEEIMKGLLEADDVGTYIEQKRYGDDTFGTWKIRFNNFPNGKGIYGANAFLNAGTAKEQKVTAEGDSPEAAVAAVKSKIEFMNRANDTSLKFSEAHLCFNAEFTRDVLSQGITGVRLVGHGDSVFLLVAGAEYFEAFGNEIYGKGPTNFVRLHARLTSKQLPTDNGGGAVQLYMASITGVQIKTMGLKPNGRYSLESEDVDDLGTMKFRLVFDSVTAGPNDKVRLHKPGLTIAVF
jgi:hypothetical protein